MKTRAQQNKTGTKLKSGWFFFHQTDQYCQYNSKTSAQLNEMYNSTAQVR